MPEASGYESHLSREVVAFFVGLSKKRQRLVLDLADQIAQQPFQIGDYQTVDTTGRTIEHLRFWVSLFLPGRSCEQGSPHQRHYPALIEKPTGSFHT